MFASPDPRHRLAHLAERWPLVGRTAEIREVNQCLRRGAGLVIAGGPGVGKTRLATETIKRAAALGLAAELLTASRAAASVPLGAFAPLFSDGDWRPEPAGSIAPSILADAARALRGRRAERRPSAAVVLAIDDAHLLDDLSAVLVQQLAASGDIVPIVVMRSREPTPAPLTALWKDFGFARLELFELSRAEQNQLAECALGGRLAPALAEELWRLCRGNALFVREVLLGADVAGRLALVDGVWHAQGRLSVATRLAEVVALRIGELTAAERDALELLVVAEPIELDALLRLVDWPVVEALEARGLLVVGDEPGAPTEATAGWPRTARTPSTAQTPKVRLTHPMYGDVLADGLAPLRRRRLVQRLASAAPATLGCGDLLRRTTWRHQSGLELRWSARLVAASRGRSTDPSTAVALFDGPAGGPLSARLKQALHWDLGQSTPGPSRWRGLIEPNSGVTDPTIEAIGAVTAGRFAGPVSSNRAAPPEEREVAFAVVSDIARRFAAVARGFPDAVATPAPRAARHRSSLVVGVALAGLVDVQALIVQARIGEARVQAHSLLQSELLIARRGGHGPVAIARLAQALVEFEAGDRCAAAASLAELGRPELIWPAGLGPLATLAHTLADRDVGRPAEPEWAVLSPYRIRAEAARWAAQQHHEDAVALVMTEAERASAAGDAVGAARCWHDAARWGAAVAAAPRLRLLAGQAPAPLLALLAAHATALVDHDGDALLHSSIAFEEAGLIALAAECARSAERCLRPGGRTSVADACWARHQRLVAAAPGWRSDAIDAPPPSDIDLRRTAPSSRLTPSEHRACLLAAEGRSDREIAVGLGTSVRTVQTHLGRAYRKLDVHGRSELAAALGLKPGATSSITQLAMTPT